MCRKGRGDAAFGHPLEKILVVPSEDDEIG